MPTVRRATAEEVAQSAAPLPPTISPAPSRNVADLMLEQLWQWGVRAIFGVQGTGVLGITDAIHRQDRLRFVETRQGLAAALMASAHAKLTDRLSVCLGPAGPGVTELLTGLYDAATDGAPVLALCGEASGALVGRRTYQTIDQHALFEAISHFNHTLVVPEKATDELMRASKVALERRTVSRLGFTADTIQTPVASSPIGPEGHLILERWAAPPQRCAQAVEMLAAARRPAILVGWGARQARAMVARCAEVFDAPVVTTCRAKGLLPEVHPLVLGVTGRHGAPVARSVAQEADVLLVVGCSLSEQTCCDGQLIGKDTQIIQVDTDPEQIGTDYPVALALVGDAFLTLDQILAEAVPVQREEYRRELSERKRDWRIRIEQQARSDATPILPQRAIHELSQVCAEDAIIALDVGDTATFYCQQFVGRNQRTITSGHMGVLGFSVPAANAAALARPEQQSIALCGDGGFSAIMGEFLTACQYHLPITVVLLNNGEMAMTADREEAEGFAPPSFDIQLARCDYAAYARSCGGLGLRVDKPEDLRPALERALGANVPALVQIDVDPNARPI